MKKIKPIYLILITTILCFITPVIAKQLEAYILEHESEIALTQAGTHNGGGKTTGYNFFAKADDLKLVFRKRVLHPGSAIGYHLQKEDEIYYIVEGEGEMQMNGKSFTVKSGDAILTRPGSSHGLKNTSNKDLTIIINYEKK
ncbi:cupin domain-containing protein [Pedobacter alpinus]|uniref:Cupin domain-containing protein n=1 Tax=Pedobacter alpinus TaxID=1590643 RepID=A0ABW5TNF4_9SPHI